MDSPTVDAAPAQPETPPATVSATRAAANAGDFAAFDKSDLAARRGNPLPDVAAAPPAVAEPAAPAPTVSKRQQVINDYIRTIEELKAENARLKVPAPAAPRSEDKPVAAAAPAPKTPEWKRYAAMPDAPKLTAVNADGSAVFDSVEEHTAAMSLFIADKRHDEREAAARATASQHERVAWREKAVEAFDKGVEALKQADPEIESKIQPLTQRMGSSRGPDYVLGQLALASDVGPQIFQYLHEHPETEAALLAVTPQVRSGEDHVELIKARFFRLEGRLQAAGSTSPSTAAADQADQAAPVAVPSPVSALPPPAPVLTRPGSVADPRAAAITRGDFASFHASETQKVIARRTGA